MRIALVAPLVSPIVQPFTGGAQAVVAALAQGLQRRGHEVTLFAREGSALSGVSIEAISVPESVQPSQFSQINQSTSPDPGFFPQANIFLDLFLRLQRLHHQFDIVHCHAFDWPAFTLSPLAAPLPVVHTLHLPAIVPEICEALRVLQHYTHLIKLVTVSQACAESYIPYTPLDGVIYNGLDLAIVPFSPHVEDDAPLLFAGRMSPEKGVVEAIEIALHADYPLLIAGGIYDPGYFAQEVQPRIERSQGKISYVGQLEHAALWDLMGRVRGQLFPTMWDEPFGMVPIEAMATGTPVIAFNRGAASEVLRDRETGFLVPPGNIEQAAACIPLLGEISRERCRSHVATHFSLDAMLDGHERFFQENIQ